MVVVLPLMHSPWCLDYYRLSDQFVHLAVFLGLGMGHILRTFLLGPCKQIRRKFQRWAGEGG